MDNSLSSPQEYAQTWAGGPDCLRSISCKTGGFPLEFTSPDNYPKKVEFITIIVILEISPFDKVCRNEAKVPIGIRYKYSELMKQLGKKA